jgi:benzoyl-CoA 2,3-dioxygenase component B
MAINYSEKIPNNVNLTDDRTLQRALEHWQPNVSCVVADDGSVRPRCRGHLSAHRRRRRRGWWAATATCSMPDYRWGIFLATRAGDARSGFGDHMGEPAGRGAGRASRRCAADRHAGRHRAGVGRAAAPARPTAPSLYDLRNLFQVNVEEGRHLWAMVYLLHRYFGRDGREEAEELLERHRATRQARASSGRSTSRPDWLSFFMFTYFTDRDGKYPAQASPRARSTRWRDDRVHAD